MSSVSPRPSLSLRGNKFLFPRNQSLSVLLYPQLKTSRKKKCEAIFCLTLAGSQICRGFKEHDLITCESKVQVLEINRVYDFKYLSIVLDHVGYVISRLGKRVGVLGRIRKNTMHAALEMYKSLILLILEYCDVVWASCNDADIERLESWQRRASKIIVKSKCSTISIDYLKFQS